MYILGISAFYHDSAAALLKDGVIIAAAQEERFSRQKHDARFPVHAIGYCLSEAGITLADVTYVAFFEKPFLKFERLLETYLASVPHGFASFRIAIPLWLKEKLFQKSLLAKMLAEFDPEFDAEQKLLFAEHHQSHAASAFFPSPFKEAAVLTIDGVGEWASASAAIGRGNTLSLFKEMHFPHSLGLLYSAFTYYLGFKVNSGEYKVMGLAPYGNPTYAQTILDHVVDVKTDGSFRLDQRYFNYCTGLTMTSEALHTLLGAPPRTAESPLTQRHMDIAASIQAVTEYIMSKLVRALMQETGMRNLCLAGGVALNCVANGKILREGLVDNLWIQPAAGDAGGSLGAALAAHHGLLGQPRTPVAQDTMQGSYLGPAFTQAEVEQRLRDAGAVFEVVDENTLMETVAEALATGQAVGWHQGRMEFGPRALGARSIIGDPRSPTMQKNLNLKIKYRESFRPFAPSVLHEHVADWFEMECDSPYMLLVAPVRESHRIAPTGKEKALFGIDSLNVARSDIPAVTHLDYSARVQTVHQETNPRYYKLLQAFHARTGCPVLVNTSFNVRGEPIVCTPEDSFRCFMGTELDMVVVENCLLRKSLQNSALKRDYKENFALD
jgi:carbamoyltransferase